MAERSTQSDDAASLRSKAERFLGGIPSGYATRDAGNSEGNDGPDGTNARPLDPGTIDPTKVSAKRRGPTAEYQRARKARLKAEAAAGSSGPDATPEKMAVSSGEPPLPDPTLIGFATEGLGFLNLFLSLRFNSPEFSAIPRDRNEMVASAWLKFLGYYVSIAKASGPMGALAGALVATAFVYGPPAMMTLRQAQGRLPVPPSGPSEGAESMFAAAMPPAN